MPFDGFLVILAYALSGGIPPRQIVLRASIAELGSFAIQGVRLREVERDTTALTVSQGKVMLSAGVTCIG